MLFDFSFFCHREFFFFFFFSSFFVVVFFFIVFSMFSSPSSFLDHMKQQSQARVEPAVVRLRRLPAYDLFDSDLDDGDDPDTDSTDSTDPTAPMSMSVSIAQICKRDHDVVCVAPQQYRLDPFNPANREITRDQAQRLLNAYGASMDIYNPALYVRAFVHTSYVRRPAHVYAQNNVQLAACPAGCAELYTKSNEQLEFLGDGVLELIAKFYLYKRFPKSDEGFKSDMKMQLVKNATIGRIAKEMGLDQWLMLSAHAEKQHVRQNPAKLGCLFEALVGAIFLDFNRVPVEDTAGWFEQFKCGPGFQVAQLFVERVFDRHVDWTELLTHTSNHKRPLQELLQCEFRTVPTMEPVPAFSGSPGFHVGVFLRLGRPSVPPPTHASASNNNINNNNNLRARSQLAAAAMHPQQQPSSSAAIPLRMFHSFAEIHRYVARHQSAYIQLGEGVHKIKLEAEQAACDAAIRAIRSTFTDFDDVAGKLQQKHCAFS